MTVFTPSISWRIELISLAVLIQLQPGISSCTVSLAASAG